MLARLLDETRSEALAVVATPLERLGKPIEAPIPTRAVRGSWLLSAPSSSSTLAHQLQQGTSWSCRWRLQTFLERIERLIGEDQPYWRAGDVRRRIVGCHEHAQRLLHHEPRREPVTLGERVELLSKLRRDDCGEWSGGAHPVLLFVMGALVCGEPVMTSLVSVHILPRKRRHYTVRPLSVVEDEAHEGSDRGLVREGLAWFWCKTGVYLSKSQHLNYPNVYSNTSILHK